MKKKLFLVASWTLLTATGLISCSSQSNTSTQGSLSLVANGEDFIREGFVAKDGWRLDFDRAYVTLANVTAYQTNPPFNPESGSKIPASKQVVLLDTAKTVDLAAGASDAQPILVAKVKAPAGKYNALSWQLVRASQGKAQEKTIVLEGTAKKDGQTVKFIIGFDRPLDYFCGQYVGDDRRGILKAGAQAQLETTFHFDHIFGDAQAAADDPLNVSALGFQPMATLAKDGKLEVDMATLKEKLSERDYEKLEQAIASLGHVGEGHCRVGKI